MYTTPGAIAGNTLLPITPDRTQDRKLLGNPMGALFRDEFLVQPAGATLHVNPGYTRLSPVPINHTKPLIVRGPGADFARIDTTKTGTGPGFELCDGVWYDGLTLGQPIPLDVEGELFGFGSGRPDRKGNCTAGASKCRFIGTGWCIYIWSEYGNRLRFFDCDFSAARRVLACETSTGPDAAFIEAYFCRTVADDSLSDAGGDVGPSTVGITCSAGEVIYSGGSIVVKGSPRNNRLGPDGKPGFCAAAWTYKEKSARIKLRDVDVYIFPNGADNWYHFVDETGGIDHAGCRFYDPDGKVMAEPKVRS